MLPGDPVGRMESVRIEEIMIPLDEYPKVTPETSLRDAIEVMENAVLEVAGRKSLPRVLLVFDNKGRLRGTVRRRDIMRGLEPKYLVAQSLNYRKKLFDVAIDPNLSELSHDRMVRGVREQAKRPVKDVMRPIQVSLDHNDHVIKGVYEMVGYGLTLLPVMKDEKVIGVVRTVEIFRELANIVLSSEQDPT
jgi:predicted transcriptional regulator